MGWIDVLTDMVKGLRATGKSEKEIKAIVEQAADQATVNRAKRDSEPETVWKKENDYLRDMPPVDEMDEYNRQHPPVSVVISAAGRASLEAAVRRESNNWRKMHGLPMRRKGGNRNGRAGNSHRH